MTDGQRPLRELEKRLEKEPDNLSLRVTVAGMLSEAGRKAEAVELYRSVALAYREQGRNQQAVAVCRSILELAPDDIAIHALVAELTKTGRPATQDDLVTPTGGATGTGERRPRTPSAGEPTRTGSRPPPGIDEPATKPPDRPASATGSQRLAPIKPETPPTADGTPQHPRPATTPPAQPAKTKSQPPASAAALISRPLVPSPAGTKTPSRPPAVRTPPAGLPTVKPSAGSIPGIPRRTIAEVDTPLPKAVPYHVADPTSSPMKVPAEDTEEDSPSSREDVITKPGGDPEERRELTGLAQAARRISGLIAQDQLPPPRHDDILVELDTRQVPRLSAAELEKVSQPPPTVPIDKVDEDELHDLPTPIPPPTPKAERAWRRPTSPAIPIRDTPMDPPTDLNNIGPRDTDEELTSPRELQTADPLANAFFVALPANRRDAALARCTKKSVRAGATVIRQGETSHPLILVVAGKLELRIERANGTIAILDTIDTGQYIGEAALLGRTPASANVIAMVDCELLALPPHALFELAGAYPALWAALKDTAEKRTRQYEKVIRASP